MSGYLSFFRIRFINGLQYRAAAYAGMVTQFVWGGMEILMFRAFYTANPEAFPMGFSQLSSYVWLQQAFLAMFMIWFTDNEIFDAISSGNIAYELSRPMDLYNMWFTKNLAIRLSKAVLRCMPILLVAAVIPAPYGLSAPAGIPAFFLFLSAMVLGFFCVVAFCMYLYIATFYTLNPLGIRILALSMSEFLTGAIIPLPFLPDGVRKIVEWTPFAAMQNLPFRIYSGNINGSDMISGILLQGFWLVVLVITGKRWMTRALKRVVAQGG